MKKSILFLATTLLIGTFASCSKDKAITPERKAKVSIVEDTMNLEVLFPDTTVTFGPTDFTLTVVDITNGEGSTVFVNTTKVSGVLIGSPYVGNRLKLPRTSTVERIYRIYVGGRIFDNVKGIYVGVNSHTNQPDGYLDVAVGTDGTVRSFPDRALYYFSSLQTGTIPNIPNETITAEF